MFAKFFLLVLSCVDDIGGFFLRSYRWSGSYIKQMIATFKEKHPNIPVALYMAGSGGHLERMQSTGADVIALDWSIDLADARQRLGVDQALQVAF